MTVVHNVKVVDGLFDDLRLGNGHKVLLLGWTDPDEDGFSLPGLGVDQSDCLLGPEHCGTPHLTDEEIDAGDGAVLA